MCQHQASNVQRSRAVAMQVAVRCVHKETPAYCRQFLSVKKWLQMSPLRDRPLCPCWHFTFPPLDVALIERSGATRHVITWCLSSDAWMTVLLRRYGHLDKCLTLNTGVASRFWHNALYKSKVAGNCQCNVISEHHTVQRYGQGKLQLHTFLNSKLTFRRRNYVFFLNFSTLCI